MIGCGGFFLFFLGGSLQDKGLVDATSFFLIGGGGGGVCRTRS